jgi:aspartokinase/homoserine dehydrogenase 1
MSQVTRDGGGIEVFKFGGTSVGSPEALRTAASHVEAAQGRVAAVVSAMNGVTDLLLAAAEAARDGRGGEVEHATGEFRRRHLDLVTAVVPTPARAAELAAAVEASAQELAGMCGSIHILRELTPRTRDAVVARGERLLALVFTALLQERGLRATYVDAPLVVHTVRRGGALWPDLPRCAQAAARHVRKALKPGRPVVMPGYIGTGPDGELVTLGRGGSDLSAAILAYSLQATQCTLWKEVDGLMTADPRAVPEARVVPELHYREAAELAYYGASVLHPRTMMPLVARGIPLRVRNTFNVGFAGTRVSGDAKPGPFPVKALTAILHQAMVSVEGSGMIGVPGVAARTFGALAQAGHSVTMISQASSESSICFVVPETEAAHAESAVRQAFALEMRDGLVDDVRVERGVALVAVVGQGMRGSPGIAARAFSAVSREKVNVLAIAQGSSELNITMGVAEKDVPRALQALHREYQLERLRPLAHTDGREVALTVLGFGQIGRTLTRQLAQQDRYFRYELGLELRCVALVDRSGIKVREKGFPPAQLEELAARKESGGRLFARRAQGVAELRRGLLEKVWSLPARRPVLVDTTAEETAPLIREALEKRCHVVLANKKPLAVAQVEFDRLVETARRSKVSLRYEATVGAGLPVLDTLRKLSEAGDQVETILGCLSGTLGYVMTQLEGGAPYAEAVRRAWELGYTEPDPRDDLSGLDVARKALILARTLGRRLELSDVAVEPLFPAELGDPDPQRFLENLRALDGLMNERLEAARRKHEVLRYVARIAKDGLKVGVEAVPEASPLGRLHGTDNQVVLHTRRYRTNPLVVTGPGAGAEVTASGVLNDILAIATGGTR